MEIRDSKAAQFTHPSDFEQSSIPALSDLDNVLRCQVCKDYFQTPSMTSCSHTFCSMCIRQALSSSGQCPTCRKKDQTVHLRRNWPIQEAVAAWRKVRADVLNSAAHITKSSPDAKDNGRVQGAMNNLETSAEKSAKKRAIEDVEDASENPRYRTRSKRNHENAPEHSHPAFANLNIAEDDKHDADYEDDNQDIAPAQSAQAGKMIKVSCPICGEQMLESYVFAHLDHCNGAKKTPGNASYGAGQASITKSSTATTTDSNTNALVVKSAASQPPPKVDIERITFLSYDMMKEPALKKKLQQLGIRTDGNKTLMKARHMYWVDLWNANADSDTPRSRRELLDDLAIWERAVGRNHAGGPTKDSTNGIMRKDFDREGYQMQNNDAFNDLITQARRTAKSKAQTPSERVSRTVSPPSAPEPAASMFLGAAAQLNAATAARRGSNAIQYLSSPTHLQHSASSGESPVRQMPLYQVQEHVIQDMDEDMR